MALTDDQNRDLTQVFQDRLLAGERFESIVQARRVASEVLGEPVLPGTAIAKETEEVIEQGVVRTARQLIQQGKAEGRSPVETFEQLIDLYERQPRLGMRSSTSVLRQQYSTPLPLAYLGSRLAGIDANTMVYEPTAGHGALLLEANPEKATVNEIDDDRAADLRRQGYQVTQQDATGYSPVPRSQDVVIANPPFGRRRKAGRAEQFVIGAEATAIRTSQLDHVIVWNALESMKDDGRAVLLIGGEKGSEAYRSDEYNTQQNRGFYYNLYRNYNVTEHFTVDGSLYSRQGAGFPVDVILIAGRGASERALPAADVPKVYGHYDELKEVFDYAVFRESPGLGAASNRAAERLLTPTGQLLRGDRSREQNRNPELRGLQVPAESSGDLDDSAVGRGAGDATGGRLSDDSPALDQGSGAGFSPASSRSGVARELRYSAGRQSMAAGLLGAGDRTGELSTTDGERRGESAVDSRGHRESDLGGVAPLFHEDSAALAPDTAHNSAVSKEGTMVDEHQHQSGQVPYVPRSQGPRLDTLIPRNMSSAVQSALDQLEGRVGDIDPFVARKLNYPSVSAMHEVLAAEQVDGVALGIDNIEHGNGALVGDQTGVGKGRQMAAMLRYAKETDRIPVFVTRDASLYRDMIRDLDDIGVKDFKPFITNGDEKVPLPDGRILKTTPKQHAAELNRFIQQGGFSPEDGYDGVFTTYSQLQTVKGHSTPRREFLNLIASQSIIVMDEAHEAGGSLQPEAWGHSGPPNRAEFARQLVDQADGVVFSSATAIKRPDVMDLYGRRSGMRAALGSVESLQQALEVGGIPLQQTCTNMLAQDGFYIRRERSYEGVNFSLQTVPVDRESTDNLSRIMGQILQFDVAKQDALKDLDKQLKASAKKVGLDSSTGLAGASSTNFTAIMHNVLDQSLLARKADQMAEAAIASLERGEKPILTVANTMGSFLESYAADADIKVGEAFDGNFSDVLMRYLERSRDVIERDFDGTITRSRLGDAELGPEAVAAFDAAKELIQATDLDLPISPIDHIKQRVEAAGYTFGEITGRNARLEYDGEGHATYQRRSTHETSKAGKVRVTDGFNSGKTDVLLLNRSGATGISLHASSKFADQHRRHMIVGQPERNITDFMQTLGRAHRTGQVVPPRITLLMGDTPDEKRPAAVLKQKMASLNANTTADRHAGFDTDSIPDFFNIYGSAVVEQLLAEYPEINQRLDYPITVSEEGADSLEDVQADAIAKVTGRLPLLTVAEQETFYELLEQEYTAFVEQQEALGNSVLEAEAVDLDARTLAQAEVMTPQSGVTSAFGAGVQAEVVDVKAQSHPKTQLEVVNEVRENLDLDPVTSIEDHDAAASDQLSHDYASSLLEKAEQVASQYLAQQTAKLEQRIRDPEKLQTALNKQTRRLDKQKTELTKLHRYRLGQTVRLATDNGRIFYGAITQVGKRGRLLEALLEDGQGSQGKGGFGDANPVVASKWEVRVSLADASNREIPIPLSKLNTDRMGAVEVTPVTQTLMGKDIMSQFDEQQTGQREVRQVLRGNLFRAAEKYGKQGHVINATVSGGSIEPMMLLPRGYNIQQELSESPVELPAARNVRQFFEITHREGIIKTSDEQITLKAAENSGEYFLETGKKQKDVYLDQNLIEAVGGEFYTVSDRFQVVIDSDDRLEAVVSYIQQGRHQRLEAVTHLDQARELIGETIPEFAWSDSVGEVIEKAGLPPSVDLSNVADVRDRLETLWQPEASKSAEEEVDSPIEPEVPAYRPDPDGPTTISRERSRLLEIFDARDVEGANDIASREDQLEALTDDLGEDARISLIDPEEQAKAIASQETCYPGQSESLQSRPVLDDRQAHFEALFSQYPDLFIRQSDSLFEELQDAPEILYQDGERDFIRIEGQLYSFQNDAIQEVLAEFGEQDEQFAATELQVSSPRVAGWRQQSGGPEKHVAQILEAAGLSEAVMADRAFYLKVENEPFIPLNIERHDEQLILYHTLIQGGDAYVDAEMIFTLSEDGTLALAETAVQNPAMGRSSDCDRSFANTFARNLRHQGFAEAAAKAVQSGQIAVTSSQAKPEANPPSLPELLAKADAIAAQPLDQEPSSTLVTQVQTTQIDYQHTLERLRVDTQGLPEPLRDSILDAIQAAEAQMLGEPQMPTEASLEKIAAGALVQAAIVQKDPDLQDQILHAGGAGVPSVEEFRDWYRKAAVMDRSAEVLSQIECMGRQAKAETLAAEGFDPAAMQADMSAYDQQASLAADIMPNVSRFLDEAVKAGVAMPSEANGTVAEGRHYRVMAKAGMISVENKATGGKLAFTERGIAEVSELTEADKSRWQRLGALEAAQLTPALPKRSQSAQPELA